MRKTKEKEAGLQWEQEADGKQRQAYFLAEELISQVEAWSADTQPLQREAPLEEKARRREEEISPLPYADETEGRREGNGDGLKKVGIIGLWEGAGASFLFGWLSWTLRKVRWENLRLYDLGREEPGKEKMDLLLVVADQQGWRERSEMQRRRYLSRLAALEQKKQPFLLVINRAENNDSRMEREEGQKETRQAEKTQTETSELAAYFPVYFPLMEMEPQMQLMMRLSVMI